MHWMFASKPEMWDHRQKSQARWFHCGLIGSTIMGRRGAQGVLDSPTTTQHQKDLAKQIVKLSEELELSLRNDRINC